MKTNGKSPVNLASSLFFCHQNEKQNRILEGEYIICPDIPQMNTNVTNKRPGAWDYLL
jgi:hypothetical protein